MTLRRLAIASFVLAVAGSVSAAGQTAATRSPVREWVQSHQRQLVADYIELLKIPNVSRDREGIRRNADFLVAALAKRGVQARLLEAPGGPPLVYGELAAPGATHTYVFYAHFDGQPIDPKAWVTPPFEPTLRTARLDLGGSVVALPAAEQPLDDNWRLYARSASDDKAQVFAMLRALDALNATGQRPRANLRFVFDGEEEIDSPHLAAVVAANRNLFTGDLWLFCDGPEHPSGRPTITFGARGIQKVEITVYGPNRELHSGHYGNWAPNPAMMLSVLLASMKDAEGHVLVDGFYDGAVPLSAGERQAIANMPNEDARLMRDMALGTTESTGKRLEDLINLPSLNVRGLASGRIGDDATNVVPSTATAAIDLRLVKGITRRQQAERVIAHLRKQGYFVTTVEPDEEIRRAHPRVARVVVDEGGYDAVRAPMSSDVAKRVIGAIAAARGTPLLQPTMGGSVPIAPVEAILGTPTILIPIANFDNSQHSSNENIRLGNLWNGIVTQAALMMMP